MFLVSMITVYLDQVSAPLLGSFLLSFGMFTYRMILRPSMVRSQKHCTCFPACFCFCFCMKCSTCQCCCVPLREVRNDTTTLYLDLKPEWTWGDVMVGCCWGCSVWWTLLVCLFAMILLSYYTSIIEISSSYINDRHFCCLSDGSRPSDDWLLLGSDLTHSAYHARSCYCVSLLNSAKMSKRLGRCYEGGKAKDPTTYHRRRAPPPRCGGSQNPWAVDNAHITGCSAGQHCSNVWCKSSPMSGCYCSPIEGKYVYNPCSSGVAPRRRVNAYDRKPTVAEMNSCNTSSTCGLH